MPTDEQPPTMGVREPRRPLPQSPSTGAQAEPPVELPAALDAIPAGACVVSED